MYIDNTLHMIKLKVFANKNIVLRGEQMKNGCYEFGFYGDLALRVDNESNVYEFMTYDYHSRLIKTKLISKEQAELIYNNYNLSDKNLVECE